MFYGRTSVDSHGAVASPAMTTWSTSSGETLVLVWAAGGGVYLASGMEQSGVISAAPIPGIATNERPALIQFEDALVLGFTGTDNQVHYAISHDGQTFPYIQAWAVGGVPITPDIGGPGLAELGPTLCVAGTAQLTQAVMLGFNVNVLPDLYQYSDTGLVSIDTPALGVTPGGLLQIGFAGVDPANYLTVQPDARNSNPPPTVVYPDECFGGPAIATTVSGYAAAFVNKQYNIVLLYGLENASAANVSRTVLQDTSGHAPAVATINGVSYVAWTDPDQTSPTSQLYFADLGSMQPVTCALNQMMRHEAGPAAGELGARLRQMRDTTLAAEPSGRRLITLIDYHGDELARLCDSDPDLRRQAWDLLRQAEPIANAAGSREAAFPAELIDAAQDLLGRLRMTASPSLRDAADQVAPLLAAMRGQTLADGLAAATRSAIP